MAPKLARLLVAIPLLSVLAASGCVGRQAFSPPAPSSSREAPSSSPSAAECAQALALLSRYGLRVAAPLGSEVISLETSAQARAHPTEDTGAAQSASRAIGLDLDAWAGRSVRRFRYGLTRTAYGYPLEAAVYVGDGRVVGANLFVSGIKGGNIQPLTWGRMRQQP